MILQPLNSAARTAAIGNYLAVADAVGASVEVAQEIRRFRWTNAHLLALEARAMISLLEGSERVPFRRARLAHWRRRYRRFMAKAYAKDHVLAFKAGLTGETP